jgi:hypothetical protein
MKAPKRGRTFTTANTYYLLDLIRKLEPCGVEEWSSLALEYSAHFGGEIRSGEDLKEAEKISVHYYSLCDATYGSYIYRFLCVLTP